MTVTTLPADPHGRVHALLRARQVSCRGGLTDLADAVLIITQPQRPRDSAIGPIGGGEAAWRRERSAVLLDRDTLVCALQDLIDAAADHLRAGTAATADQLDQAVGDAREVLVPLPAVSSAAG